MNRDAVIPDPSLRFHYDFLIPAVLGSARAKRHLNILAARTSLDEDAALRFASIQLAKWYCDDIAGDVGLHINVYVPQNALAVRAAFDKYGVEHQVISDLDEGDAENVSKVALALDCDVVLSADVDGLEKILNDDVALVDGDVDAALHAAEIHMKGFDAPWSFESPSKNQPWTNFYAMCEESIFRSLLQEMSGSAKAGPDVAEVMRSIVGDALPSMCFNRDRVEFYRQQDRWAERAVLERQNFRFEYTTGLNLFYLTLYSAVDQVAALVVHYYGLEIPEDNIGAQNRDFRKARTAIPRVNEVFSNPAFWEMYRLPRLIRHRAAHRGPVTPQTVYMGDDNFTDEQLDSAAEKHGYFEDLRVLEKHQELPENFRNYLLAMARFKAKLKLFGRPLKHVILLKDGKEGLFYNPDPASDLRRFLAFFHRVLAIIKPWDGGTATNV
jgi:hypothetical protein